VPTPTRRTSSATARRTSTRPSRGVFVGGFYPGFFGLPGFYGARFGGFYPGLGLGYGWVYPGFGWGIGRAWGFRTGFIW
jgi:hypothetical protein